MRRARSATAQPPALGAGGNWAKAGQVRLSLIISPATVEVGKDVAKAAVQAAKEASKE